jgi:hypothetical protein
MFWPTTNVFLCKTSLGAPWEIDVFKGNLIREEFARRQKVELFGIAENFILNSLKRSSRGQPQ